MQSALAELWYFFIANLRASHFGVFLLSIFLLTEVVNIPFVSRYDFIFIAAVGFQLCALVFRFEQPKEFFVIFLFHILATGMELFKTNPDIGSWKCPPAGNAVFVIFPGARFSPFLSF